MMLSQKACSMVDPFTPMVEGRAGTCSFTGSGHITFNAHIGWSCEVCGAREEHGRGATHSELQEFDMRRVISVCGYQAMTGICHAGPTISEA